MPGFVTVNDELEKSSAVSLPSRARTARSPIARAIPRSESSSACLRFGTTRPSGASTATPRFTSFSSTVAPSTTRALRPGYCRSARTVARHTNASTVRLRPCFL